MAFTVAKRGFAAGTGKPVYRATGQHWDPATAPECEQCGADYNPRRAQLGYKTCLDCAEPAVEYSFVPTHKGAYVPVRPGMDLKGLYNDKRAD